MQFPNSNGKIRHLGRPCRRFRVSLPVLAGTKNTMIQQYWSTHFAFEGLEMETTLHLDVAELLPLNGYMV